MTPSSRSDNRFDVLRLVAAWLVLFSHCYPLGGRRVPESLVDTLAIGMLGGIGVSIFFVLSGYLVAQSIERSRGLLDFARRRVVRIYPALIVVCLLSVLVLGPAMTTLPLSTYWNDGGTWYYLRTATSWTIEYTLPGVFSTNPTPNAINGSLWSLPYELRCYIALALVSVLPVALRYKALACALALAVILMLRPNLPPFETFMGLDYFMNKLGMLFAMGACYATWGDKVRPSLWVAIPLMALAVAMPKDMPVRLAVFEVGLDTAVLWLALYGKRLLPAIPTRMGDWSYGAYIYAFPVQQVLAHYRLNETSFAGYVFACTVITAALAGLSWHFIEKPAMRWKK